MLKERLRTARAGYGWLSEETADNPDRLSRRRVFVVDPIDGTRAFIKKRPEFVTALAIVEDGAPVAGVVYNPITDELYEAAAGAGATLNGAAIRVSDAAALDGARMVGPPDVFADKRWPRPWPPMDIVQKNAIAYRMALVASGAHDAMMALGWKAEWDIAAAAVILREAGGRVSDPWGGEIAFNKPDPRAPGVIAAGPRLHPSLIERVNFIPRPSPAQEQPA
jgi:myo-inositol-1(or 4)-monophosphatase